MARMKLCMCGVVIRYKDNYCKDCIDRKRIDRAEYYREYDRHRDKEDVDFYNSREWRRVREYILMRYRGIDLYAYFIDRDIIHADTVHHIVELKDDWSKRLTIANLFPCSSGNHKRIHKLYNKNKKETQKLLLKLLKKSENIF